ncbi:MAG: hypothetical protein WCF25_04945 [Acidimicrobiales bacterium]
MLVTVLATTGLVGVSATAALAMPHGVTVGLHARTSDTPVAFSQLHLDQPGGTLTPGPWTITGAPVCSSTLTPPGAETTTAALTEDLGREGLIKALESYLEKAEAEGGAGLAKWAGVFLGAAIEGHEYHEMLGAMEMFFTKFGVPGVGLGYTVHDTQVVSAGPSHSFVDAFVGNQHLGVGPTGVVFKYAQVLADDDKSRPIDGYQLIHMKIYDVSYCPFGGDCPTYAGKDVQSYLYIQMWSTQDVNGDQINGWHFSFLTSYQANSWTQALDKG